MMLRAWTTPTRSSPRAGATPEAHFPGRELARKRWENMEPDRYTIGAVQQVCPSCARIVTAMLVIGWLGYWQITDVSACNDCGRILWNWAWHRPFTQYSDVKMAPRPAQGRLF